MSKDTLPYTVGQKPNTVRVYKRSGRKNLYIRTWNAEKGGWDKRSLGHDDLEKAKVEAAELHARLVAGETAVREGRLTLRRLFALYEKHRTPQKGEAEQKADARRIRMFTRALGADTEAHEISRAAWERFIERRSSGEIDARGRPKSHPEHEDRDGVGPRTVEADLRFLLAVLNWGTTWSIKPGVYLLRENVCRGYDVPKEKNPNRPVATDERVQALRKVAHEVPMAVTWGEKREEVPSHLPCIFDLAVETGRRISSILALTWSDLLPEKGPHGSLRWRAEHDKQGRESIVPLNAAARRALDRHAARMRTLGLAGIGDAPRFPGPTDPSNPVPRRLANTWLRKAEEKADLQPHDGSLWHAYRRRWATVRKHLPATDVAEAGGWEGPETLQRVYQQADDETMYTVVSSGGELREVGS